MVDYYLEDTSRLQGQPKKTIGDYVESCGILVPKRFASLSEALQFPGKIIVRSEHSQDYYREGNLFRSVILDKRRRNYFRLRGYLVHLSDNPINTRFRPSELTERIKREVSYSFWEFLSNGENRTLVADSAIKGRYHFFTNHDDGTCSWAMVEDDEFIFGEDTVDHNLKYYVTNQIAFYESVRKLPRFVSNHCPAIEYQSIGQDNFFLQYFRTNDFREVDFSLHRPLEEGEIELEFVRGVTSSEGIQHRLEYPFTGGHYVISTDQNITLGHFSVPLSVVRKNFRNSHSIIQEIFKPTVIVVGEIDALYTPEERQKLVEQNCFHFVVEEPIMPPVIRIICDGRKGYAKRMS